MKVVSVTKKVVEIISPYEGGSVTKKVVEMLISLLGTLCQLMKYN